jgi:OTU domain-containing protein 6
MGSKKNKVKQAFAPSPAPNDNNNSVYNTNAIDDDLVDELLTALDSRDATVRRESATVLEEVQTEQAAAQAAPPDKAGSKSRFKARQGRKAAALAGQQAPINTDADAKLEREAKDEERAINRICNELGLDMHEINPDGHCLFSAVADQLATLNVVPPQEAHYTLARRAAADYMLAHPNDFVPFLPSVEGEDGAGAEDSGTIGPREFARYCASIRDTGVWGGEPEILALSRAYAIPIHVVQSGQPPVVVHDPNGAPRTDNLKEQRAVRISYHRRMYGLGEHYNSLRPKTGLQKITSPLKNLLAPQ